LNPNSMINFLLNFILLSSSILILTPPKARRFSFEKPIGTLISYSLVITAFTIVPVSFRLFVVMFVFVGLFTWRLKLNVLQVTWLYFFIFMSGTVAEAVISIFLHIMNLTHYLSITYYNWIALIIMVSLSIVISLLIRSRVHGFIERASRSPKGFQITLPILMASGALVLTFYNILMIGNGKAFKVESWIFWSFFISFSLFVFLGAFFADRYYKRHAEVFMLREQMSQNFNVKSAFSAFEASVEYDLMTSDFGQILIDQYDIKERIYEGQNSQIYILKDKDNDALATLKAMPKSEGVFSDLASLKSLEVPGIAKLITWGKGERFTYSIKPYFEGTSLSEWVEKNGVFPESDVFLITDQIKSILHNLHNQSPPVVFRDVKPSNILLRPNGSVILIDIETSRKIKRKNHSDTIIVGTRGYAPPEQFGFSQTGIYSDIYALGATAYYMATGEAPDHETVFSSDQPFKGLSKKLCDFIRGCMHFDPVLRQWN